MDIMKAYASYSLNPEGYDRFVDNQYLDCSSGVLAEDNDSVVKAAEAQSQRMSLSNRSLLSRPLAELVDALAAVAPKGLSASYICNSEEEAIDGALKLAKGLNPQRKKVLAFNASDCGTHTLGLQLTGDFPQGFLNIDIERFSYGEEQKLFDAIKDDAFALVFSLYDFNPHHGLVHLSNQTVSKLQKLCHDHGVAMILDERLSFAQSEKLFATELYDNFTPDVIVLGNTLGGGVLPMGVYLTKPELNAKVFAHRNPTMLGSTTGANPLSCTVAKASLELLVNTPYEEHSFPVFHSKIGNLGCGFFVDHKEAQKMALKLQKIGLAVKWTPGHNWIGFIPPRRLSAATAQKLAHQIKELCS